MRRCNCTGWCQSWRGLCHKGTTRTLRTMYFIPERLKACWSSPEVQGELSWCLLSEDEVTNTKETNQNLTSEENTRLIEPLKDKDALEWGVTPDKLPTLLENSVELCYELFYCLNGHQSIAKYNPHNS
eukprot:TRINITY_DN14354_c0_g2_i9.p3 TRINITY_DN14354_c0_g2~~TRINITY_DN14354_c0_g2_i9.p3  ORF type:complete len:128 (-),score=9.30 TRINITY_DN14354_c0_g2_i9:116-499(-)